MLNPTNEEPASGPVPLTVTVKLHRRERLLSGTVRENNHPERSFVGWVGLLIALEAAFGSERPSVGGAGGGSS
jgi:hypothetical protein